jgi:hypothetical protein
VNFFQIPSKPDGNSMPGSNHSDSSDDLTSCLSHLNNAIRELEATVSCNAFPISTRRAPEFEEKQQHNCPYDYSHVGLGQPGRNSISRGCPFASTSNANAPRGFSWNEEIQASSLTPAQHSSEIRVSWIFKFPSDISSLKF